MLQPAAFKATRQLTNVPNCVMRNRYDEEGHRNGVPYMMEGRILRNKNAAQTAIGE
jgi:hypothetical protein